MVGVVIHMMLAEALHRWITDAIRDGIVSVSLLAPTDRRRRVRSSRESVANGPRAIGEFQGPFCFSVYSRRPNLAA